MEDSFLIVGLGNPGKEYADTRHNIGFMILERLAKYLNFGWQLNKKFTAELAKGNIDGRNILLTKPQCYMNLSGKTVFPLAGYYKIHTKQIYSKYICNEKNHIFTIDCFTNFCCIFFNFATPS